MSVLVCGVLAYDTVMVFDDKFKLNSVDDQPLDAYYVVPDMRRGYGGGAGNIAYNLKLLEIESYPLGVAGTDFQNYADWLDSQHISREYIMDVGHSYTAQAFITQDMNDSRITAFHPGAMNFSHFNRIPADIPCKLGIISADSHEGMSAHAHQLTEQMIPHIYYPGRSLYQQTAEDILSFLQLSNWVVLTKAQAHYVEKITGLSLEQLSNRVHALAVSCGEEGAIIYTEQVKYQIPVPNTSHTYDPLGCDDAFCAGLAYAIQHDLDWETAGRIASLMWIITIQHHGAQSHHFNLAKFKQLFQQAYGYALI